MSALCADLPIYLSGLERNVQASRSALSICAAAIDLLYNAVVSCLPHSSCHWNLHMRVKTAQWTCTHVILAFMVNMLCICHLCLFCMHANIDYFKTWIWLKDAFSQANNLQSNVTVRELRWGTDTDSFGPPFDVIIASDLLYDMKSIPELMLTIVSLSSSDTVTYLAFEVRPNVIRAAFQTMEAFGLKAEEVIV